MKNGLYQVTYKGICAGFSIENGRVTSCAPVLRSRIEFWVTIAKLIKSYDNTEEKGNNEGVSI